MRWNGTVAVTVLAFVAVFVAPWLVVLARWNMWAGIGLVTLVVTGAVLIRTD